MGVREGIGEVGEGGGGFFLLKLCVVYWNHCCVYWLSFLWL